MSQNRRQIKSGCLHYQSLIYLHHIYLHYLDNKTHGLKKSDFACPAADGKLPDEAQKMISELYQERKARDQFVATLTHDLRTPLTAAMKMGQLLFKRLDEGSAIESEECDLKEVSIEALEELSATHGDRFILPASEIRNSYGSMHRAWARRVKK